MTAASTVYFIQAVGGGLIKIGCTETPAARLSALLSWSPVPLEIMATMPGDFATEAYFHFKLRRHRAHSEWFRPATPVIDAMEVVRETGGYPNAPTDLHVSRAAADRSGSAIRQIRDRLGMSRPEVAEIMGVGVGLVTQNESATSRPNRTYAGRFIAVLEERGVTLTMADLLMEHSEDEWDRLQAANRKRSIRAMAAFARPGAKRRGRPPRAEAA